MFVGYQEELPVFIGETKEWLKELPCIRLTKIVEVESAQMIDGEITHSEILNEEIIQNEEEEIN